MELGSAAVAQRRCGSADWVIRATDDGYYASDCGACAVSRADGKARVARIEFGIPGRHVLAAVASDAIQFCDGGAGCFLRTWDAGEQFLAGAILRVSAVLIGASVLLPAP